MKTLTGRNCLITGASRGLGAAIASALWHEGANIMMVARSAADLVAMTTRLPAREDQRVVTYSADLRDPLTPQRIVNEMCRLFVSIDVLVNNAAIQGPLGVFWENSPESWRELLQVDLLSPVELCRLCVPLMARTGGGKIINISGGGATGPRPNFSAYATAKVGVVRFSETIAKELVSLGIDVNCIAPGHMNSTMTAEVLSAGPSVVGHKEYETALQIQQGGGASLERAAALCVFLASPSSSGITGKILSAVWDQWEALPDHLDELNNSDVYTLRRIVPEDRSLEWD